MHESKSAPALFQTYINAPSFHNPPCKTTRQYHDQVLSSQSCAKKYASQYHSQSWRQEGAQWRSKDNIQGRH